MCVDKMTGGIHTKKEFWKIQFALLICLVSQNYAFNLYSVFFKKESDLAKLISKQICIGKSLE